LVFIVTIGGAGYSSVAKAKEQYRGTPARRECLMIMPGGVFTWVIPDFKIFIETWKDRMDKSEYETLDKVTPMEALDLVKEMYATNFDKISETDSEEYYYKLSIGDYYLVNEGLDTNEKCYQIHLYEFVLDEPESGIGHTVTYGWYNVDKITGEIL
jgi:hypothetical protein